METQPTAIFETKSRETQTSLLGFLFFMMGALHIYREIRAKNQQIKLITRIAGDSFGIISVMAMIIAGILEFLII